MPHEEQREKNIRLVTEVALDCFLANGIEKTKVADIALRSGLTERSVFRYFETKADLVLAASLLYWKRILERIDRMSHTVARRRHDRPAGRGKRPRLLFSALPPRPERHALHARRGVDAACRGQTPRDQKPAARAV